MTYKEWMLATGARFNLTESDVTLILVNRGLIDKADRPVDVTEAKRAMVSEFATMMPMCNVSEGGYSISWNVEAMKLWYYQSCGELGIEPTLMGNGIRNKSNRW